MAAQSESVEQQYFWVDSTNGRVNLGKGNILPHAGRTPKVISGAFGGYTAPDVEFANVAYSHGWEILSIIPKPDDSSKDYVVTFWFQKRK